VATDNITVARQIDNGSRTIDNLTSSSFADGTKVITRANFVSDNGSQVIVTGAFLSSTTDNTSAQIWTYVADGGKNISASGGTIDNASDTIALDLTAPTIQITSMIGKSDNLTALDNQTFTDNRTVTMVLDYNDNATTVAYFVSGYNFDYSDNTSHPTHITNLTNGTPGDNDSFANDLTKTVWSVLDNETGDNATGSYSVTDNYTGDNQTITLDLSSGDGLKTVYVWAKDIANNISLVANDNITVDTTGPVKSSTNWSLKNDATITDNLTIVIDNDTLFTDALLSVHRLYFTDNVSETPTNAGLFTRIPNGNMDNLTYNFGNGTGTYAAGNTLSLYAWAVDNASNISDNYTTASIVFDNASPTGGLDNVTVTIDNTSSGVIGFSIDNQTFYVNKTTISFDNASLLSSSSDNSTLYFQVLDNGTSGASGVYDTNSVSTSVSKSGLTEGTNTLYVWAKDPAGNGPTLIDNLTVIVDTTAPTIDNITLYEGDTDNSSYTIDNGTLKIDFNDNATDGSGLGVHKYYASTSNTFVDNASLWKVYNSTDNGTIDVANISTKEGDNVTVYVWMIDNVSNVNRSGYATDQITVFVQDPSGNANGNGGANHADNTTVNSISSSSISENVTIPLVATDNFVVKSYYITSTESENVGTASNWVNFTNPGPSVSENASFSLSGQTLVDNMTLYLWLRDNSSQITDNYTLTYAKLIDNASPVISNFTIFDNTTGSDNVTHINDNVSKLSITASDAFKVQYYYVSDNASDNISVANFTAFSSSGVSISENITYIFDNSTLTSGDNLTLHVWVKDNNSNVSAFGSDNITYY
jgi:hypothetical protein